MVVVSPLVAVDFGQIGRRPFRSQIRIKGPFGCTTKKKSSIRFGSKSEAAHNRRVSDHNFAEVSRLAFAKTKKGVEFFYGTRQNRSSEPISMR
jgi:hypothetical protein